MTEANCGVVLRDAAMDAIENAEEAVGDWFSLAYQKARSVAASRMMFTSDDVWELMRPYAEPNTDRRVMGSVMRRLQRDHIAVRTNYTEPSKRRSCHARPISLWRSLIYRP